MASKPILFLYTTVPEDKTFDLESNAVVVLMQAKHTRARSPFNKAGSKHFSFLVFCWKVETTDGQQNSWGQEPYQWSICIPLFLYWVEFTFIERKCWGGVCQECLRWLIAGGAATDSMMRRATEPRRVESEKNVGSTEVMQMYDMIWEENAFDFSRHY